MKTNTFYLYWKDQRHDSEPTLLPSPTPKDQIYTYIQNDMNNWAIIQIFGLKYSDILHKIIWVLLSVNY